MKLLVLGALFALAANARACDALIVTGYAYHADRSHGYNDSTWGLGCEWRWRDWRTNVVGFQNSNRDASALYGAAWLPLHMGPVSLGAAVGRASGYPSPWQKVGGFVAEYEGRKHAFDANVIPRVYGMKGVVVWLRWKPLLHEPMTWRTTP
jgi:hypothetical protein